MTAKVPSTIAAAVIAGVRFVGLKKINAPMASFSIVDDASI
jgi:hypothetical protein